MIQTILNNTDTLIGQESLEEKLKSGRPLRIKLGVDPTRPDLTFGHLVVFNKLRQFQELGHEANLIIGDFTTLIGDPSGRSSTRPVLTNDEIKENAKTYLDQAFKILKKTQTKVHYNSDWFGKMGFEDLLQLARKMTVARMLERDDFSKRFASNAPISIVEFLYPLIQGYDSLILDADVEIGGTDQLFNMLVGRTLQRDAGKSEQAIITMPLLVGLDGTKKMSKSADNYIAFTDSPKDMFGKIMSIDDTTMWTYHQLLLETSEDDIEAMKQAHPMQTKKDLAKSLVSRFYSESVGENELAQFDQVFSKNNVPNDMPTFTWDELSENPKEDLIINIMHETKLFESKGAIRRLIAQGGVKINGEKMTDQQKLIKGDEHSLVIQAGKRIFFKLFKK